MRVTPITPLVACSRGALFETLTGFYRLKTPAKSQVKKMGRNLARLRDAGGMTQEVIAEKAEMHWRHYQKIEAGEIAPGFHALVRLKRALACTWDELFGSIQ